MNDFAVHVSIGLRSEELDPEEVTRTLDLKPSWAFRKGERISARNPSQLRPWGVWGWRSQDQLKSDDMEQHLEVFLNVFEPRAKALEKYLEDPEVRIAIRFDFKADFLEGGYTISSSRLRRACALCKEMDYSFLTRDGDLDSGQLH